MTLEERIEVAAKAEFEVGGRYWHLANEGVREFERARARRILGFAFPELFTTPPTAWLAPVEPDDDMVDAAREIVPLWDGAVSRKSFERMRDSWTSRNV